MRSLERLILTLSTAVCLLIIQPAAPNAADQPQAQSPKAESIDFDRARTLFRRMRQGAKLTDEERRYLDRARELRRQQQAGQPQKPQKPQTPQPVPKDLVPISELKTTYKGQDGGLYGGGRNVPPEEHQAAVARATQRIQPLDAAGQPSPDGRIVLLSIGMSNTTQEFSTFQRLAMNDPEKSPQVVLVDGAQGGQDSEAWVAPGISDRVWNNVADRLRQARITPQQVQVVWLKQARKMPARLGDFPKHADTLAADIAAILQKAKKEFPNLQVAYLSNRTYAGYAKTPLNPEPYAYESAFAVRTVIQSQMKGDPALNSDPQRGPVQSPVVLWGPNLWTNGETPRAEDGLIWTPEDVANDGTHPSPSGREKVAKLLLTFFKRDPLAKTWFTKLTGG